MELRDFYFDLPEALIATHPAKERTSSRLLFLNKKTGELQHYHFRDIAPFFKSGDVLVVNNTKVLPARLLGKRKTGGQAEALLLKNLGQNKWEALLRPGGRIKKGETITFVRGSESIDLEVLEEARKDSPRRLVLVVNQNAEEAIERVGHMPLPPYIQREDTQEDRKRYQTVFSKHTGAVAAPTAGLHFDEVLLRRLEAKGVEVVEVTLHVSYGTFQPVAEDVLEKTELFEEEFEISANAAATLNAARSEGRRIIACGTTSVRTLESSVDAEGNLVPQKSATKIFIKPGYEFKIVQGLITNFHLPESTLLMLVSAFAGREKVLAAYGTAVKEKYRFYSYGDAMLIL